MNLYTLYSKNKTIRRVFYGAPLTPTGVALEQASLDRQEYQLSYDFHAERLKAFNIQEAKDAREMARMFRAGIERVES